MKVLLIEEGPKAANRMKDALQNGGFKAFVTDEGEDGVKLARLYPYDLVVVSMSLGDIAGLEVIRMLRRRHLQVCIMAAADSNTPAEEALCLNSGADDYVSKFVNPEAFAARARALVRRAFGHADSVIEIGDLALNLNERCVSFKGGRVPLTRKEYALFELIAIRNGRLARTEAILDNLYGGLEEPEFKVVDVFVCKLRKKLSEATGGLNFIETVWGEGFKLIKEEPASAQRAA